jgi:hypothetical protein
MAPSRGARRPCAQPSYQGIWQSGRTDETGSQGVKDRRATSKLNSDPDSCELADTIPGAPAQRKPNAHRAAEAIGTPRAGRDAHARPAHAASDATVAGMRAAFGQTARLLPATWQTACCHECRRIGTALQVPCTPTVNRQAFVVELWVPTAWSAAWAGARGRLPGLCIWPNTSDQTAGLAPAGALARAADGLLGHLRVAQPAPQGRPDLADGGFRLAGGSRVAEDRQAGRAQKSAASWRIWFGLWSLMVMVAGRGSGAG